MKKFSIIIALAPDRTAPVLESLSKLDYPKKDYEIIIEKGLSPSENRNKAIKKAEGEILYFLDDDAVVDADILKKAEPFFNDYKVDILGGPQLTPKDDNFFAKASGCVISSFLATHKMSNRYKQGKLNLNADESCLTSANLFIKKEVFNLTSAFNPKLYPGEDPELIARLKSLNFKVAYCPDIFIYHKRRPTFKSFFKQFFNYGKTAVQKEKTEVTKLSLVFIMPSLFLLYLISLPFLFFVKTLFITPLLVYFVLISSNSFYLAIKHKNLVSLPLLLIIFLSIHIAYGSGLIAGLFKRIF